MADNLTDTAEALALAWLSGEGTAPTRPTAPLMLRLVTASGSDSAAGTQVANAGGSAYSPQDANLNAAGTTNTAEIRFTNMPACTVVGGELWDSAGTPVRVWWGPLAANKTVNLGDDFVIAAGDLDLSLG
ncbi:hypothetical protein ABN028_20070 [Actinopolymorpha sp. B17G11]|uniref:phage tail fiber protein n=1 Tax=Actinopolymorpha sp. B17G11 TaxID=3160861 RepID=UPI0032E37D17